MSTIRRMIYKQYKHFYKHPYKHFQGRTVEPTRGERPSMCVIFAIFVIFVLFVIKSVGLSLTGCVYGLLSVWWKVCIGAVMGLFSGRNYLQI